MTSADDGVYRASAGGDPDRDLSQAVLERGVLTYFRCRADASSGVRRQDFRYLDGARVAAGEGPQGASMVLRFNDGAMHRLRCDDGDDRVSRQVSQATQGQVSRSVRPHRVSQRVSQVIQRGWQVSPVTQGQSGHTRPASRPVRSQIGVVGD